MRWWVVAAIGCGPADLDQACVDLRCPDVDTVDCMPGAELGPECEEPCASWLAEECGIAFVY